MKEEYWTTKNGDNLAVSDMDEEHVRHCLRMMIRRDRERKEKLRECDATASNDITLLLFTALVYIVHRAICNAGSASSATQLDGKGAQDDSLRLLFCFLYNFINH